MTESVLLIGNGINNIKQDYRWSDLIDNLIEHIGAAGQIATRDKPFPLLYEEIFVEAVKNRKFSELQIKEFIAKEVRKIEATEIHQEILKIGSTNILTTNYDYTLESALLGLNNFRNPEVKSVEGALLNDPFPKNNGIIKESVYSIFRNHAIKGTKFWHIHGDAYLPNSIALGYDHYSGYLQQMRNYVATGTGTSYKTKFNGLIQRLKSGRFENFSWLDFFFKNDIYIIGLSLDFVEIHLWWLLTFRQRAKLTKRATIKNRIIYFYPSVYGDKIKNKLDLLKSSGIIPFSVKYNPNNRQKYYTEVIAKIKTGI